MSSTSDFEAALSFTLRFEGGYVNHPEDPGGETKFGISKRAYPAMDIKNLTRFQAAEIYKRDYWSRSGCEDLHPALAVCVFDFAVNSGVVRARNVLKSVLGIEPDADWQRVVHSTASIPVQETVDDYQWRRVMFLIGLDKPVFIKGWMRRVVSLSVFAGSLLGYGLENKPVTREV